MLQQEENGELIYDQVILAGHSLGSVVAYDALDRLSNDLNTGNWRFPKDKRERLPGLVTFGSPLDKIALFFWPNNELPSPAKNRKHLPAAADKDNWSILRADFQSRLLAHYHGMRGLRPQLWDGTEARADAKRFRWQQRDLADQPLRHVLWLGHRLIKS